MRKARVLELVEPIPFDEFVKVRDHVTNSMVWYCVNQSVNTSKLVEKMRSKGVEDRSYECVDQDGELFQFDFVKSSLDFVRELNLLDDVHYAESVARRFLASGKGVNILAGHLRSKGVEPELVEQIVDSHRETEAQSHELEKVYDRLVRSSTYRRKKGPRERRDYLFSSLLRKGFSFDDVKSLHESRSDEQGGEG